MPSTTPGSARTRQCRSTAMVPEPAAASTGAANRALAKYGYLEAANSRPAATLAASRGTSLNRAARHRGAKA